MKPRKSRPSSRHIVRPPGPSVSPRTYAAALAAIVIAGALVRIAAAQGELWLDEIWSFRLAHLASGIAGVFTGLHNDNNHYLNTLYLRFIQEGTGSWWIYRLPALVFGTAAIGLGALIARRRSQVAALAAAILLSGSFLLVVYSSEARGYTTAICFAFATVLAVDRYLTTGALIWGGLAAVSATLALLGHLTALHALAGVAAWLVLRQWRQPGASVLPVLLTVFALPAITLALLYWFDLRHLQLGGGPLTSAGDIGANALSLAVGGPETGGSKVIATLAALTAAVAAIAAIHRSGSDLWILFLVAGLVAPAVTLAIVDTGVIYERYLLVALAFITLSFAWVIERVSARSVVAAASLLLVFVIANGVRTWRFIAAGRSHYTDALSYVVQHNGSSVATLGSDHDFRNGRVVEFYLPFVSGGDIIRYQAQPEWTAAGPEWLLTHRIEPEFTPRQEITVLGRYRYRLEQFYPYAGVSGWYLMLYRNAGGAQP